MSTTPNMGLVAWESEEDFYSHNQLSANFFILDGHDHVAGRGKRITTDAIQDGAVTTPKIPDAAITEAKYGNASIPSAAYKPGSVDTTALKDAGVTTPKIADRSVTRAKLAEEILPLGTIIAWWRPSIATAIPEDWEICDGHQLTAANHEFGGGGTITLPDMRNRFILGAATGSTGTGPTDTPAIGQTGGSNNANLSHTHTVSHSHTIEAHTHTINAHSHTVNAHRHTVEAHGHTVDAHSHIVPTHVHPIPNHAHSISHRHIVDNHGHAINGDGAHAHTIAGGFSLHQRGYEIFAGGTKRQALYAAGYNEGGTDVVANMDAAGFHSHGGATQSASPGTGQPVDGAGNPVANSGGWGGSTDGSSQFSTQSAAPGTSLEQPFTTMETAGTNSVALTTNPSTGSTSTDAPVTSSALSNADVRPNYIGLLFLIKVKR